MLLLIDNYDSFTCNIAGLFNKLNQDVIIQKNNETSLEEIRILSPDFIVIGPGPGRPKDAGLSIKILKEFAGKIPILGICLGHQAIGESFGSNIIKSRMPSHGKLEVILHEGKGIFKGVKAPFTAVRYNSLVIDAISPLSELEITAMNHSKEIMGVRHKFLSVEGVQFHPESIFSEEGEKLFQNFLEFKPSF